MFRTLAILAIPLAVVLLQAVAPAAPVPKTPLNPLAKKLVGTWRYGSDGRAGPLPPWGTAVATLTEDGKITATFGPSGPKDGLFADMAGTYKLQGDTLRTTVLQGKGTKFETKREDVMTVLKVTEDELHLAYRNDKGNKEKSAFILKREEPDKQR